MSFNDSCINWQEPDELLVDSGCFYNNYSKKDVVLPVWRMHISDLYYPHPIFEKQMAFAANRVGYAVHVYDFFARKKSVNYAKIERFEGLRDLRCEFEHILMMSPTFVKKHGHEQFELVKIHTENAIGGGWYDVEYAYDASPNTQRECYHTALHNIDDICLLYSNSSVNICNMSNKKINQKQHLYKKNREGVLRFQIFLIKI